MEEPLKQLAEHVALSIEVVAILAATIGSLEAGAGRMMSRGGPIRRGERCG
jgi:hypothetical protein